MCGRDTLVGCVWNVLLMRRPESPSLTRCDTELGQRSWEKHGGKSRGGQELGEEGSEKLKENEKQWPRTDSRGKVRGRGKGREKQALRSSVDHSRAFCMAVLTIICVSFLFFPFY